MRRYFRVPVIRGQKRSSAYFYESDDGHFDLLYGWMEYSSSLHRTLAEAMNDFRNKLQNEHNRNNDGVQVLLGRVEEVSYQEAEEGRPSRALEELDLKLASIPLRQLNSAGMPIGSASSCIVNYSGNHILLTVSHAVGNNGRWAIELEFEPGNGTKLYQIGPQNINYLSLGTLGSGRFRELDFAYSILPCHILPYYQEVGPDQSISARIERKILPLDLAMTPDGSKRYGFAGYTHASSQGGFLLGVSRVYSGLSFAGQEDEYYRFTLPANHPPADFFQGCSGAPIMDEHGNVVALVCHGFGSDQRTLFGIALKTFRAPMDILVGNI